MLAGLPFKLFLFLLFLINEIGPILTFQVWLRKWKHIGGLDNAIRSILRTHSPVNVRYARVVHVANWIVFEKEAQAAIHEPAMFMHDHIAVC